jgi:hypothetical protein
MSKLAIDANAKPIQVLRPNSTQLVNIRSTSNTTATGASKGGRVLRLATDIDCFYAIGSTATTSDVYLPAGTVEYIHVFEGDNVSVIRSTADGTLYVTEMV